MSDVRIFWIDLFCGAGGTSTGIEKANAGAEVVACVNHDQKAIESHKKNHPNCLHLIEDIRDYKVVQSLKLLVEKLRLEHPGCYINIWASLECTNFSKAKGGLPRDADSRTLAEHLYMYLEAIVPDFLMIENVMEFMSWGPLDNNGKPVSKKRGGDYLKWVETVKSFGYRYDWKELNAANFGAYTSRTRFFGQFAKDNLPIYWPEITHTKNPEKVTTLFDRHLKKWKAVKDVLDLQSEGKSIFGRKKPLVENTLKRIYAGLLKFVANGDESFLLKYNSTSKNGKHSPPGINEPCPTVACQNRLGIVNTEFLQSYYGNGNSHSVGEPCPTVSTKDRFAKVSPQFLVDYQYKSNPRSIENPAPTIVTKDKFAKISPQFLVNSYNGGGGISSIENPAPTILNVPKSNLTKCDFIDQQFGKSKPSSVYDPLGSITQNPKYALVNVEPWLMTTSYDNKGRSLNEPSPTVLAGRKHHYLLNPQFSNKGNSVDQPSPVIIARQDKKPLSLVACEIGSGYLIPVYEDDSETMMKIKKFMAYYGIIDIKMRMLFVRELLRIQGFPENYRLVGTQTEQKKFIGNSVEVNQARAIIDANCQALQDYKISCLKKTV